eukprot:scaffold206860_cov20-Tisochrysis_lutea.AAC.1
MDRPWFYPLFQSLRAPDFRCFCNAPAHASAVHSLEPHCLRSMILNGPRLPFQVHSFHHNRTGYHISNHIPKYAVHLRTSKWCLSTQ